VFKSASRSKDRCFTVLFRENDRGVARLGMAIAKKHCRHATARNRIKRIIRESFREHQKTLGAMDFVVINQRPAATADNKQLFDSLAAHWERSLTANRKARTQEQTKNG
jgi:ribonuclease P protein component